MQRPFFSQSPKRVGSGPSRPPTSFGGTGVGAVGVVVGSAGILATLASEVFELVIVLPVIELLRRVFELVRIAPLDSRRHGAYIEQPVLYLQ
jgi:hypothetical protein